MMINKKSLKYQLKKSKFKNKFYNHGIKKINDPQQHPFFFP